MNSLQIMPPDSILNNDVIYTTLLFIILFSVISVSTYNILNNKNNNK